MLLEYSGRGSSKQQSDSSIVSSAAMDSNVSMRPPCIEYIKSNGLEVPEVEETKLRSLVDDISNSSQTLDKLG